MPRSTNIATRSGLLHPGGAAQATGSTPSEGSPRPAFGPVGLAARPTAVGATDGRHHLGWRGRVSSGAATARRSPRAATSPVPKACPARPRSAEASRIRCSASPRSAGATCGAQIARTRGRDRAWARVEPANHTRRDPPTPSHRAAPPSTRPACRRRRGARGRNRHQHRRHQGRQGSLSRDGPKSSSSTGQDCRPQASEVALLEHQALGPHTRVSTSSQASAAFAAIRYQCTAFATSDPGTSSRRGSSGGPRPTTGAGCRAAGR